MKMRKEALVSDQPTVSFRLTWMQRAFWMVLPLMLSALIVIYGEVLTGVVGSIVFVLLGALLGLVTWFISAGWTYNLEVTAGEIRIKDTRQQVTIPLEKVGMLIRNGGFPFPTLWLVLKNAETGAEIPAKGVDLQAQGLVEAYRRRNPGKKLTVVTVPGGHLRSVADFAAELKRRIPPLTVDERLSGK